MHLLKLLGCALGFWWKTCEEAAVAQCACLVWCGSWCHLFNTGVCFLSEFAVQHLILGLAFPVHGVKY